MSTLDQKTVAHLERASGCEVHTSPLYRNLYATDASIYQVMPAAAALPRNADEAAKLLGAAAEAGIPITPRGAGSGLAGGALGDGLIVDFSKHNRGITEFNPEARTVRVGAGVVLDQLNAYLKPHGLMFGPDVATSSRATLGGMIANNSSGARAPIFGTTIDHVNHLDLALPDGAMRRVGKGEGRLHGQDAELASWIMAHEALIAEAMHDGIPKRWPGYALDRYLRNGQNPAAVLGGSEGTLAAVCSAELRLVPIPPKKGLAVVFFASIEEAMQATVELLDLEPAGIEHIDDVLFDQTRGQLLFQPARDLLELDAKPCKALLLVEFYENESDKLAAFEGRNLGLRKYVCRDEAEMAHVWSMRKAGLSLLTGRKGPAKPTAGIEDVAVPPARLPDYVAALRGVLEPLGLEASFYGHAASGLLHVRPVVDLHQAGDVAKFRQVGDAVAGLTREFRGSLAGEHGVGIARTEYMRGQLPPELLEVMGKIKAMYDPGNHMNPGKIFDAGVYRFDGHLRQGAGSALELPFEPKLVFAHKDESFIGNLEQCNGCGGCRKDGPTMCPTFMATGDESMSTRGRANIIRAALEARIRPGSREVFTPELDHAISNCLSCKACLTECPSNVNMALLKAELQFARIQRDGLPLAARMLSRVDLLGQLASYTPGLANAGLRAGWVRRILSAVLGIAPERPLPPYAAQPFHRWFDARKPAVPGRAGQVILWDDCFVRYNEPHIGRAAVAVLEAAGYEVVRPKGRACCGRPAFSMGRLDLAESFGRTNLALLERGSAPIVFLEPSCFTMFSQDYRELGLPGAGALEPRVFLFEEFMDQVLEERPDALHFRDAEGSTAIHAHCHAKSTRDTQCMPRLARRIPGNGVRLLDTGCCGMAGAFGAMKAKYDLSLKVAEPLVEKINALDEDTRLVASGTSCRHQIEHLTAARPLHMVELLAGALAAPPEHPENRGRPNGV